MPEQESQTQEHIPDVVTKGEGHATKEDDTEIEGKAQTVEIEQAGPQKSEVLSSTLDKSFEDSKEVAALEEPQKTISPLLKDEDKLEETVHPTAAAATEKAEDALLVKASTTEVVLSEQLPTQSELETKKELQHDEPKVTVPGQPLGDDGDNDDDEHHDGKEDVQSVIKVVNEEQTKKIEDHTPYNVEQIEDDKKQTIQEECFEIKPCKDERTGKDVEVIGLAKEAQIDVGPNKSGIDSEKLALEKEPSAEMTCPKNEIQERDTQEEIVSDREDKKEADKADSNANVSTHQG